jgi:A/G-specific adenine glycosylase
LKPRRRTTGIDQRTPAIIRTILRWYSRASRPLPWRGEKNPYRILLSEIMLQQTQVNRVLEKYPEFLNRFPDFTTLARARTASVIRAWKGMGYNNRAVRLQRLAQWVVREKGGKLPNTIPQLQSLPGVGKYTAHALACFAFNKNVPVVDINVERVLKRLYPSDAKRLDAWSLAERVLPGKKAYDWNQALMDLGSTICVSSNPRCSACPAAKLCPSSFKVKKPAQSQKRIEPSRDGLPNRIYRGRIVEVLRHTSPNHSVPLSRLGRQIKQGFSKQDAAWLMELLSRLQEDGLVALKRTKSELLASLPR